MAPIAFTVGATPIAVNSDGLYSLNDFHKAAGAEEKHRPNQFLRNDQTLALIAEIQNAQICAFKTIAGRNGGTYACRELVIAYAAWISPAFHLKVIRVFLDRAAPGALPALAAKGEGRILPQFDEVFARKLESLPRLQFPRPVKRPSDRANPYPRDGETIAVAQGIARAIRDWAPCLGACPRVYNDLLDAALTLEKLLVRGWTEVDEALCAMSDACHYLNRWQGRGGRRGNVGG